MVLEKTGGSNPIFPVTSPLGRVLWSLYLVESNRKQAAVTAKTTSGQIPGDHPDEGVDGYARTERLWEGRFKTSRFLIRPSFALLLHQQGTCVCVTPHEHVVALFWSSSSSRRGSRGKIWGGGNAPSIGAEPQPKMPKDRQMDAWTKLLSITAHHTQ